MVKNLFLLVSYFSYSYYEPPETLILFLFSIGLINFAICFCNFINSPYSRLLRLKILKVLLKIVF